MGEPRFWGKNSQTRAEVLLRIMGWTLNLGPEYLSSVVTIYQGGNRSMERGRRVYEEALPPQHTHLQTKCLWSTTRATPQRAGDHCHSPWLSRGPASHQHHPHVTLRAASVPTGLRQLSPKLLGKGSLPLSLVI